MTVKVVSPSPPFERPVNIPAASARTISVGQFKPDPGVKRLANRLLLKYMTIKLVQPETSIILMAYMVDKQRVFVGRGDPEMKQPLDIDLLAYGGREKGVSRLHAAFRRIGHMLAIVDLNSTNGTYHNGLRLSPGQTDFLVNGDQVCLGNMQFHIHFGY